MYDPELYSLYKTYSRTELFDILLQPDNYQPVAVDTAKYIVQENRWQQDLTIAKQKQQADNDDMQASDEEKAAYFKHAVELKNENQSIYAGDTYGAEFEYELTEQGIDFFHEGIDPYNEALSFPTFTYYFRKEDWARADKILAQVQQDEKIRYKPKQTNLYIIIGLLIIMVVGIYAYYLWFQAHIK